MKDMRREISQRLLKAKDASQFVQEAFALLASRQGPSSKMNFAELARKMGFRSRSFVRLLAIGERRPNLQNFRRIAVGLGLTPEETEYFGLLLERERSPAVSIRFTKRLDEAELKLRRNLQKSLRRFRGTDPIPFERWPFIYAALGPVNVGRTREDIIRLSGQDPRVCIQILDDLVKRELVTFEPKRQRYFAKDEMIDIGELGSSKTLKSLFQLLSLEAVRRVDSDLSSDHSLFHSSVFSVRADRLPELTRELQRVLAQFAASAEDADGDNLALLNATLIPHHRS
jgi:transcriptional regulator with XRE-family HTH domain